jgi:thiamine-phosphate pyrophosphorylase
MFSIYLITPDLPVDVLVARTASALGLGTRGTRRSWHGHVALQLRAKSLSSAEQLEVALRLRELTMRADVPLFVNDRLDIAQLASADGVQLPEAGVPIARARALLGPHATIGASCHDASGIARAQAQGASFATLAPVFDVPHKGAALGADRFGQLVSSAKLPVFALGGVGPEHAHELIAHGASGLALIRAVYETDDPEAALSACCDAWANAMTHRRT